MAKARALDKRRKSIRNIRKITRTMELIATARFKKAMDRATAASAYTKRITQLVADLTKTGLKVSHPLLEGRAETKSAILLVLTANRGLCGGYNGSVLRQAVPRLNELSSTTSKVETEMAGKRGIAAFKFRKLPMSHTYTHFEDQPKFEEVEQLANRYLEAYAAGELDRLDVAYTKFVSSSRQTAVVETLLPLGSLSGADASDAAAGEAGSGSGSDYEFLPSAETILEEVVPTSFKIRLFKCFLDAAVSEQIARMVAMKAATENASEMIHQLSSEYNRARQSQITGEIMEIIGGVEALKG
ncbi:MAG TPA: ATP synthase F1 subunit gamma [Pirellulaceae bacterium]|nr:ATP synthase F1 subunit gamma [Pirellulaceae bacterium]